MKTLFSLICALLTFHGYLSAQAFFEPQKLAGQVRSYRYINPYTTQVVSFDRAGNETERTVYKPDGSIEHQASTFYNQDGTVSGWKEYYGKDTANAEGLNKHAVFTYRDGKLSEVVVYREDIICYKSVNVYDDQGRKLREINSGEDAIFTSRDYRYDAAGNLIEERSTGTSYSHKIERVFDAMRHPVVERYFDNQILKFTYHRTYEANNLIKEESVDPSGKTIRLTVNKYNAAGKLIESALTTEGITSTTVIQYDQIGRMKEKEVLTIRKPEGIYSSNDPSPGRTVTKYNELGSETERLNYSEESALIGRQTSSFNERGQAREMVTYKPSGEIESRFLYEYDEHGNRIKAILITMSPGGEEQRSVFEQRLITYY